MGRPPQSLRHRLLWFAGIWAGSVLALGVLAYGLRLWLVP